MDVGCDTFDECKVLNVALNNTKQNFQSKFILHKFLVLLLSVNFLIN